MIKPSFLKRSAAVASILAAAELFSSVAHADEMRALWVDAFGNGFLNSNQVAQLVADCRTYNFNAVVVQMRRRGDAFYMPQAPNGDPRTTAIASNYDALQEVINQCNNGSPRIEVHVWAPANLIWGDTTKAPTQANHVFNLHPEYLTQTSGGVTQFAEGYFLDPGNPDAMQWNYNMAKDIVSRYDIDGFHWDYIRYPQPDSGYNPVAISRYNAEFGLTGQPSPSNAQFSNWRRRQVTDFLRWVNADLIATKPSLMVSASVFGSRSDAFNARYQDWANWNNEGIIDMAFPMIYSADNSIFTPRMNDAFVNQGVRRVYVGLGAYLNNKENTVTQLDLVRSKGFFGSSVFSYRTPNAGTVNQAETFEYIRSNYQPTWENVPALPWIASPTKGLVKGTVTRQDNGEGIYNATVTLSGNTNRTQRTEAHGKYAFFEVTPGTYNVSASSGGASSAASTVTVTAGEIHTLDLSIDMPAIPDNTAPTVSNVRVVNVSSNTCTITWTTDEASDSSVEFGVTSTYGQSTNNPARVLNHSMTVCGLEPATTYQFRVVSRDAAGNEDASSNGQFITPPAQSDMIVDTQEATVVGPWTLQTSATDKFGADYRFRGRGTGSNYLQFTPQFAVSGNYQVFEWHSAGSNRATNVPVVVTSLAGTQTYFVNQQNNGGKWNYIGTFYFQAGAGGNVKVTDGFGDTTAGRVVMADAVRFIYLPNQTVDDIIVDNSSAVLTGAWSLTTSAADKFGANYLFRSRGTGANMATFSPQVTVSGDYQVYEWHSAGSNRGTNVPHVVNHATGTQTLRVNQASNGGRWNLIGTFGFTAGNGGFVRITDGFSIPTNGVVMADAIRLAYVPPPAPPTAPSDLTATVVSATQIDLSWSASASGLNFVVGRSEVEGGPYNDIATVAANVTSYSDTSVAADNTYFYVVRAVGIGGPSNNSDEASATTLPLAPAAPSTLAATAAGPTQIDLTWTDNDGGAELSFVVSRSTSASGPFEDVANVPARITSYSDTELAPVTTYYYQVRAQNAGGTSDNSNVASATTPAAIPTAPSAVFANAISSTRVLVTWTDNASNEDSYTVLRDSGAGYVEIGTVGANSTSFADETVTAHNSYSYIVRAVNQAGSADSAPASASTPNTKPVASAIAANTSVGSNCDAQVTLDGSGSSDADGDTLSYTWTGSFGTVSGATPSVTLGKGTHVISLTVDDGFGGTASAQVTVEVSDTTAPTLILNGAASITVERLNSYVDAGATASDNCSGDLTSSIVVSGSVDATVAGTYTLTYTVQDAAGNSSTATRTVTVVDTTAPVISALTANVYYLVPVNHKMIPVTLSATVDDATATTRIASITSSQPDNGTGDGNTVIDFEITGAMTCNLRAEREGSQKDRIYTVTVESVDTYGNTSTRNITIIAPHDNRTSE